MNAETQATYLTAVPLLVLGGLYLLAAATLLPAAWAERRRIRELELTLALVFPAGGVAALLFGIGVLRDPGSFDRTPWLGLAAVLVAATPLYAYAFRFRERALLLTGSTRAREAEQRSSHEQRRREALAAFTGRLPRARTAEEVGELLVEAARTVLDVDFAGLLLVDDGIARGAAATLDGTPPPWWGEVRIDLAREPAAASSVVFEAAPLAVYDLGSAGTVHRGLVERLSAKSAAFVPVISGTAVVGVVAAVTTRSRRAFTGDELAVLQELAAEAALALERTRSAAALAEAVERERLVSRLGHKVRSELDLDAVLDVLVEEAAAALDGERCLVRLGAPGERLPVAREWHRPGLEGVGDRADRLAVSNLAARERRTVAVADVDDAPELDEHAPGGRAVLRELGSRAVLATPIVVFDDLVGVFAVHRIEPHAWSADEVALAEAVAREAGLAIHTGRLLAENRRRLEQQMALVSAAQALGAELSLDAVMEQLVKEVVPLVGGDSADCWLFEPDGVTLRCRAVHGLPESEVGRRIPAEGTIGEVIATGRPMLKRDFARTERPEPSEAYRAFSEIMDAPIAGRDGARGVLGVCSREPSRFTERDLDLLEALAGLASLAVRNAEAFEESSRRARVERGFYRIAAVLAEPLSLEATLDAIAQVAAEALGGAFAAVVAPRGDRLVLAGEHELPADVHEALAEGLPADETALREAARDGRLLAARDVEADTRFSEPTRAIARTAGCRGLVAVPVQAGRDAEDAGMALVFTTDVREFRDDDLELARHLAGAARGALERSTLFEQERSARSLAQQLARTGSLLATELEPEAVLDEVVRQAPVLVGTDACAIRVVEGDELVVSAVEGLDETLLGLRSPATAWLSGDVVQSRSPLALEDAASDPRLRAADPVLEAGFSAYLGVPLTAPEGALHGVLSLYSRTAKQWRVEEVEALVALAANASAALSNAELYQRVAIEKERSFAILANIADGIVAVDRDGKVVLWNNAAEQITGVPAEEALGRTPFQVLGRTLESDGGGPAGDRMVSILRGSDEVYLSLTEAIMRDPAGLVAGRIFAFRDISADRLVEQMKSEFVSTISQELRRPLTSIYGFAETLLRRDVLFGEEERRTFLGYIASESERLTAIVDALLNVARIDSDDLQVSVEATDVAAAVTETVAAAEQTAAGNGHRFVVELPDAPLVVAADPDRLRQVLANLLDNAVKYSPAGGTVTVGARRKQDRVELSVADEGIGIPAAEQERIFRKFYRADAGGSRQGLGGTGVGLFIVQGLVAKMGGRIWVTSAEGAGSRFTFELPLAQSTPESAMSESTAERV